MDRWRDRLSLFELWAGSGAITLVGLLIGVLVAPKVVYDRFLWQYLWGPVFADAHNARCAIKDSGGVEIVTQTSCQAVTGIVARPGYTLVSEVVYMITLIWALVGVLLFLRWIDLQRPREVFVALVPFVFFGGALRVVEDALDTAPAGVSGIEYPLNTLLISPLIYVTVFLITLIALLATRRLSDRGVLTPNRALGVIGIATVAITVGYLLWLSFQTAFVHFLPQFTILTMVFASVTTAAVWWGLRRWKPSVTATTGWLGVVVIWAHAIDGSSNVLGLDWGGELGYPGGDLYPKHPVNAAVVDITRAIFPAEVIHFIGSTWPFLLLKLGVAAIVVSLFEEEFFEDSPRFALLLLFAIMVVGLGPGTRDMLRATFGI